MSILDLFCSVDAFWQRFGPLWERELLRSGARPATPSTRDAAAPSRDPHHPDALPAIRVPDLQRLLHPARPDPLASGVSRGF